MSALSQPEPETNIARYEEKRRIVTIAYRVYPNAVVEFAGSIFTPEHLKSDEEKFRDRIMHHWEQSHQYSEYKKSDAFKVCSSSKDAVLYKNNIQDSYYFLKWKHSKHYAKVEREIREHIEKSRGVVEVYVARDHNYTAKQRLEKRPLHSVLPTAIEQKHYRHITLKKPVAPEFDKSEEYAEWKKSAEYANYKKSKDYKDRLKQRWQQSKEYKAWKGTEAFRDYKKSGFAWDMNPLMQEWLNGNTFVELKDRKHWEQSEQFQRWSQRPEIREWYDWVDVKMDYLRALEKFLRKEVYRKGTKNEERMSRTEAMRVRNSIKADYSVEPQNGESPDSCIRELVQENRVRNIHRYEELNKKLPVWDDRKLGSSDEDEIDSHNFDKKRRNAVDYGRGGARFAFEVPT